MPCQPRFVCGTHDITLDAPITEDRANLASRDISQTMGLRSVSDTFGKKFGYTLKWGGLSKPQYDSLIDLYEHHLDEGIPVTFIYPRWSSSNNVLCNLEISTMKIKGIRNDYFVEFNADLVEINPR